MLTPSQAVKSTKSLVAKEVDKKLFEIRALTNNALWRGKKIISTKQWQVWKHKREHQYELLDCVPEDYVEIPILMYTQDEKLEEKRLAWYKDYYDYLEDKKSAAYGESKCRSCILHPITSYCNESLRKILLKGLDKNCVFPCGTLNMFECPHGQDKEDSDIPLLILRDIWKAISDALQHAGNLESSKIPVQNIKDIYNVLTNSESLEIIIEQYIKSVEEIEKEGKNTVQGSKYLRQIKKPTIEYIVSLKNKIKIDELTNFEGKNLEEEKEEKKRQEETKKWLAENKDS